MLQCSPALSGNKDILFRFVAVQLPATVLIQGEDLKEFIAIYCGASVQHACYYY